MSKIGLHLSKEHTFSRREAGEINLGTPNKISAPNYDSFVRPFVARMKWVVSRRDFCRFVFFFSLLKVSRENVYTFTKKLWNSVWKYFVQFNMKCTFMYWNCSEQKHGSDNTFYTYNLFLVLKTENFVFQKEIFWTLRNI